MVEWFKIFRLYLVPLKTKFYKIWNINVNLKPSYRHLQRVVLCFRLKCACATGICIFPLDVRMRNNTFHVLSLCIRHTQVENRTFRARVTKNHIIIKIVYYVTRRKKQRLWMSARLVARAKLGQISHDSKSLLLSVSRLQFFLTSLS